KPRVFRDVRGRHQVEGARYEFVVDELAADDGLSLDVAHAIWGVSVVGFGKVALGQIRFAVDADGPDAGANPLHAEEAHGAARIDLFSTQVLGRRGTTRRSTKSRRHGKQPLQQLAPRQGASVARARAERGTLHRRTI